jgi:hypothetical protein
MAQVDLQHAHLEQEEPSWTLKEIDLRRLRELAALLSEDLDTLGFDRTLSETQDRWREFQTCQILVRAIQGGRPPNGKWRC